MKITKIFIAVMIVLIAAYDVYTIVLYGTETSVSHVMITWAYEYPVFPFVMGFVMGHLFWRMGQTKKLDELGARVKHE